MQHWTEIGLLINYICGIKLAETIKIIMNIDGMVYIHMKKF